MWKDKRYLALTAAAYALSIVPPFICTIAFFPVWVASSAECTVSGIALVLLLICAIPAFRAIKQYLKSPSAPIVWGLVMVFSYALKAIIDAVFVIALVGTITSVAAMFVFKYRNGLFPEKEK